MSPVLHSLAEKIEQEVRWLHRLRARPVGPTTASAFAEVVIAPVFGRKADPRRFLRIEAPPSDEGEIIHYLHESGQLGGRARDHIGPYVFHGVDVYIVRDLPGWRIINPFRTGV